MITGSNKELLRTVFLTDQRSSRYLAMDGVVILVTGIALLSLWGVMEPETAAIAALALGNLIGALVFGVDIQRRPGRLPAMLKLYGSYWPKTRWALAGAAIGETQMRFYVFAVELLRGSAALGLLQAGRVIVNPISMLAFAWARAIRRAWPSACTPMTATRPCRCWDPVSC